MIQSVFAPSVRAQSQGSSLFLIPLGVAALLASCSGAASDGDPGDPGGPGDGVAGASGAAATGAIQDRTFDPTGATLIVTFEGGIEQADAEDETFYSAGMRTVQSAIQLQPTLVRLTLDAAAVPGDVALTVLEGMRDLEGEISPGAQGLAIASTDTDPPAASSLSALAVSGTANDQLKVAFDDDMVQADIESITRWNVESPLGTPVDLTGAEVVYVPADRMATLTLEGGQNLQTSDSVAAIVTSVRDIGGNTIESTTFGVDAVSSAVEGDQIPPRLLTAYPGATPNTLRLIFDEPVQFVQSADLIASTPIQGTRVVLEEATAPGVENGATGSTSAVRELGAQLTFSVAPEAGDTVDVFGIADLAGNVMEPVLAYPVEARDETPPKIASGGVTLTAIEGEHNDLFRVQFDRPVHPDGLADSRRYGLLFNFFENLDGAEGTWNGSDAIEFVLKGKTDHEVQTGGTYALAVVQFMSLQGISVDSISQEGSIVGVGDATPPFVLSARLDPSIASSVVVDFSEAVNADLAATPSSFKIAGQSATSAEVLSPRVVRVTFESAPGAGASLDVASSALTDRAGNEATSAASVSIQLADTTAPDFSTKGEAVAGAAVDLVTAQFTESVELSTLLDPANWTLTQAGAPLSLADAVFTYASSARTLTIHLADTIYLQNGAELRLTAATLVDQSGNTAQSTSRTGLVFGDSAAPTGLTAFVNYREATDGTVIDVIPSEGLDAAVSDPSQWTASGGQTVLAVSLITPNRARVTLSAALGAADTLTLLSVIDLAGNDSGGTATVNPVE